MKKLLVTAIASALLTPTLGFAQAVPSVGDRVRIRYADGTPLIGTVQGMSADDLTLASPATGSRVVGFDRIEIIERSLGERRRFARNLVITMGVVAGAGGIVSAVSWSPCRETGFLACMLHPESRSEAFTWGFVGGGVLGLPLGAVIGLAAKSERWEPLTRPALGPVALRVVARGGRGVGLRASIPFGGYSR